MNKEELSSKDLLLTFLYSPGIESENNEPIAGRTKLTKMMFLFEKEIYPHFFEETMQMELPEFKPYYFGPFSRKLFEDLDFFITIGMINSEETNIPLSNADKIESNNVFEDEDDDSEDMFGEDTAFGEYELSYFLSDIGCSYVKEKLWDKFTFVQQDKLKQFKSQINKISLDSLLRYVYNKYPEFAKKSIVADRYMNEADG